MNQPETLPATTEPTKEQLAKETNPILINAKAIKIDGQMMFEIATEEVRAIKRKISDLEERRKAITRPLDEAKKSAMDLFRTPISTLEEAERIIKRTMLTYTTEQENKAREERKLAEAAAEKERNRLAAEAAEAEQQGDIATAITLQETAEMITAHTPTVSTPKASGATTTKRWSAEVVDKEAFIRHALENPEYFDMVTIDMLPLNRMAVAMKDKLNIPGIKAVGTTSLSIRS